MCCSFGDLVKRAVDKEMECQQDNEREQEDHDECDIYTTHQYIRHSINDGSVLMDHQITFWKIPVSYRNGHSDDIIVEISVIITGL